MGQGTMRRLAVWFLCVCILILPGCGKEYPRNGVTRTSELAEKLMENVRRDERIEYLLPKTVKTLDEREHVYDLGALIPEQEDMIFWDYAVTEKGKVLLLYGTDLMVDGYDPYADEYYDGEYDYDVEADTGDMSDQEEGTNDPEESCRFTILSLDVITGEITTLVENRDAEIPAEESYLYIGIKRY